MKNTLRAAAVLLAASSPRRLRRRSGHPQEPRRADPDFPKIDEVQKTGMPGIYDPGRHRHPLHRRERQLPDPGRGDRYQDARQPHRAAHRQADGDRLQEPAAQGRSSGSRAPARGSSSSSPTRTAATARSSSATCRKSRTSPSTPSSIRSSAAIRRRSRSDLVRQGQHQGLARLDDQGHPAENSPNCDTSALQRNPPSARSTASTARPGWCSRTAASAPARSMPTIEKLLVTARGKS